MGLLDNVFGSSSNPAVPGGNVTKPLMIALLALLASRYLSGGSKAGPASASPPTRYPRHPPQRPTPLQVTSLAALGACSNSSSRMVSAMRSISWINIGPNKPVAPGQISNALGPDVIDALSQRTGLSKDQILQILSQVLPNTVDQLTPQGRLPT